MGAQHMADDTRIAYLIMAHKNPDQVARLVRVLDDRGVHFYIHINKNEGAVYKAVRELLKDYGNVYWVERVPVRWADCGLVRATLNGIRAIVQSGTTPDMVVLLSGQDYPVRSNAEIKETLGRYEGCQLIETFALPHAEWPGRGGLDRIERYYYYIDGHILRYPPATDNGLLRSLAGQVASVLGIERKLPHGYQPYGGSTWWTLSRQCIEYIDDWVDTDEGQDLIRFYEHCFAPGEMFFQTVIMNSPFRDTVVNDDLRYIDWSVTASHPKVLSLEDFESMRRSERLFARKFEPDRDAQVLDLIDAHIAVHSTQAQ